MSSLENKYIFMTGGTSGLGKISALRAAQDGANMIILARNKEKGSQLIQDFESQHPKAKGSIELVEGNLNSFASIARACDEVISKYPVLDLLVNNAGIMNFEPKQTVDGIEETLQVNLLSPLLITHLLLDNLKKAESPKIIFTASGLHQGEIHFDNLEFNNNFSSFRVYRQSKLGVILACRLLAKSLEKKGISIYSQHPGMVRTELGRNAGWFSRMVFWLMGSSPEKGSQNLSFLMRANNADLTSGEYYADKKIKTTTEQAYDLVVADKLLELAEDYLSKYMNADKLLYRDQIEA